MSLIQHVRTLWRSYRSALACARCGARPGVNHESCACCNSTAGERQTW